jgi:hypothetical protein
LPKWLHDTADVREKTEKELLHTRQGIAPSLAQMIEQGLRRANGDSRQASNFFGACTADACNAAKLFE